MRLRDDDGDWVTAGDWVTFSYGIPPRSVTAKIIERAGQLIGLCPGHSPSEFNLRSLRRYVCVWYRAVPPANNVISEREAGSEEQGA